METDNNRWQRFNISDICRGSNSVICGKRLSGKSHLMVDIIHKRIENNNAKVVLFASKYVAPSYKKYFRPEDIYERYDPKVLKNLILEQQGNPDNELVIGFDDIAVNKNLWNDNYIKDIVRYGSSLGITAIFSIQYTGQLDEMFKRNIDYVFVFRDNIIEDQMLVYNEFGKMFPTFGDFKILYDECIMEPYRCIVIDLKTPKKDMRQSVYWYKSTKDLKKLPPLESKQQPTSILSYFSFLISQYSRSLPM